MKREDWTELVQALHLPVCCFPNYKQLSKRFGVTEQALGSIYAQENQRRIVQSNSRLQEQLPFLAAEYLKTDDFLGICCAYNWPPCFLIRRLLEIEPWNLGRQRITKTLRDPELILAASPPAGPGGRDWEARKARMLRDIRAAILCDPTNSPEADVARREMGLEFEGRLAEQLGSLGLSFWTEDALRAQGFFKTPDAKLQVPFLYRGRVISWIDSKATFGGDYIHQQQMQEQYQKYVNRYGAGMVVYWFGAVDDLADADGDVISVSALPTAAEIVCLPCLDVSRGLENGSGGSQGCTH